MSKPKKETGNQQSNTPPVHSPVRKSETSSKQPANDDGSRGGSREGNVGHDRNMEKEQPSR